jgi:hypothetical protein
MAEVVIDIVGRDNFSSTLGNFGNIMTGIRSTIDLVTGAFNAAVGVVTPFINAATESEDAVANLESTLRSMGDVTGLSSQQLQDMAGGLQQITRYSDETILNGEAMLLTFGNIGGDVFPRATEAMLDLASKFGSVDQASVMLGKALNDPIAGVTALRRVGVQLTEQQEEQIKAFMEAGDIASAQGVILGELERQVGGLAEAYGDTFAGKLEIFKNRLGEIQETIGRALLPILTDMMDAFIVWMPLLEDFGGRVAGVFNAFADAGANSDAFRNAIANLFGVDTVDQILPRIDQFVADIFDSIADAINTWAAGSGPQQLSDRIVSFIENIGTGNTMDSAALRAMQRILVALVNAVGRIDWSAIGQAIDTGFAEWSQQAGQGLDTWIAEALSGNNETLNALDQWFSDLSIAAGTALDNWDDQIIAGIRDGIVNGLNNIELGINQWVYDHIILPIKRALGIASPSSVFMDIGRNIVLGLIAGLGSMAGTLMSFIGSIVDMILAPLQPVLDLLGLDGGSLGTSSTVDPNSGLGGLSGGTTGSHTTGTTTTSTGAAGSVVNNFYGNVYFQGLGEIGYDCPSPHPLLAASGQSLLPSGVTT